METALVLSGGGAKGAFQAGALKKLAEHGFNYNSIAGVSVGALNGIMTASGQTNRMVEIWRTITRDQIYMKRSIPRIALKFIAYKIGISSPPRSIYSNEPLFKLLKRELENITVTTPLTIGRIDLESGQYLNEIVPKSTDFAKQILASTAIPVVWEPVVIDGKMYVDGGIRNTTPLKDAVLTNPDRIVVITNGPLHAFKENTNLTDIIDIAERSLDIMLDEIFREDLKRCIQINELVRQAEAEGVTLTSKSGRPLKNFELLIIAPPESLGSALNFERDRLDILLQMGEEAAEKAAINNKF